MIQNEFISIDANFIGRIQIRTLGVPQIPESPWPDRRRPTSRYSGSEERYKRVVRGIQVVLEHMMTSVVAQLTVLLLLLSDAGNHRACRTRFNKRAIATQFATRLYLVCFIWMVLWNYQNSLLSFGKSGAGIFYSIHYWFMALTLFTPVATFLRLLYT